MRPTARGLLTAVLPGPADLLAPRPLLAAVLVALGVWWIWPVAWRRHDLAARLSPVREDRTTRAVARRAGVLRAGVLRAGVLRAGGRRADARRVGGRDPAVRGPAPALPDSGALRASAAVARAGLTPDRVWHELGAAAGHPAVDLVRRVSEATGAPVAHGLLALAACSRRHDEGRRERDAALAAARSTARLLAALPALGPLLGLALHADPWRVLLGTAPGRATGGVAVLLWIGGGAWIRALTRRAAHAGRVGETDGVPHVLLVDLVAAAVEGGAAPSTALAAVVDAAGPLAAAAGETAELVEAAVRLAERTGAGPVELLRAAADESVQRRRWEAAEAAQRLSVRVIVPVGLCLLPAFLLLTVVPIVLGVIGAGTGAGTGGGGG